MWHTKYASAAPINLGLGFDFWPCSEGKFHHWASVVRGQAPEREPSGYDLKGGTLLIFIQICPFEITFIFQDDQKKIKLLFWDSERFLILLASKLQISFS